MGSRWIETKPIAFLKLMMFVMGFVAIANVSAHSAPSPAVTTNATTPENSLLDNGVSGMSEGVGWQASAPAIDAQLNSVQKSLKAVFAELNQSDLPLGTDTLRSLSTQTQNALDNATALDGQIASFQSVYENYLKIVGATPVAGEDANIAAQRKQILTQLAAIRSASTREKLYTLQAKQLQFEINRRNNLLHKALLSEQIASPLAPAFWHALFQELPRNKRAFAPGGRNAAGVVSGGNSAYPGPFFQWQRFIAALTATAAAIFVTARPAFAALRRLNTLLVERLAHTDTKPPQVFLLPIALNGFVSAFVALLAWGAASMALAIDQNENAALCAVIVGTLPACGFVIGAGLSILSRAKFIQEALPNAPRALYGTDWLIAGAIFCQNLLAFLNQEYVLGITTLRFLEALYAILVSMSFLSFCRRLSRSDDQHPTNLIPPLRGISALIALTVWCAVLDGYVAFAFTIVSWLVALSVGIAILALFALCLKELTTRLLAPGTPIAARMAPLGVSARRIEQIGVLVSGIGNVLLLFVLIAIAQSGGNFDVGTISSRFHALLTGQTISGVPVSLNTIFACLMILVVAYYGIRQVCRWLSARLFPTTQLDIGTQSSILSIFTYTAWIAAFLIALSEAGLTMQNLTWVVSALSVGIGFGLQSIVQNFVSGVILLAERPIRVGDIITIGGTQGDVRRISVRSTEIGLSDGAVMIVPNSQFITSSVTNATRLGTQGTISLAFTISADMDIEQARTILLKVAEDRSEVLHSPTPTVIVTALTTTTITLTLSAKLASARGASAIRSAIVTEAYLAFHDANLTIATA